MRFQNCVLICCVHTACFHILTVRTHSRKSNKNKKKEDFYALVNRCFIKIVFIFRLEAINAVIGGLACCVRSQMFLLFSVSSYYNKFN